MGLGSKQTASKALAVQFFEQCKSHLESKLISPHNRQLPRRAKKI
ncbi:hypothetical protein COO91_02724 [Nostoc flagelliforme CCNUN1]|uniref:Uncharacterized protein n=1 Tax=Nostoc flagelliforme CCNUN1 TaxID=2038116 RepID=A0A2K8SMY5_9NOSO|nr:hypothetical protein COO91_02724 [Nostoc flagelliforme CCNUN1]